MFTRTTGILIVPAWIAAMGWLFAHDVMPRWRAEEPPSLQVQTWLDDAHRQSQYALLLNDVPIGTIWTEHLGDVQSVQRHDLIWIERFPILVAPLRLTVTSTFTGEGLLDEIDVRFRGHDMAPIVLHGERFHADFSFTLEKGAQETAFKLPLTDGSLIHGAMSPFTRLEELEIGQTWRVQVFNPIAALVGIGNRFTSMLVRVTDRQNIEFGGRSVPCFVIEAENARIWVDDHGNVLSQEMTLPVGRLRWVRSQSFDAAAKRAARRYVFDRRRRDSGR